MNMQPSRNPEPSEPTGAGRKRGESQPGDAAAALERARHFVRALPAAPPEPTADAPIDLLAAMATDDHPYTKLLKRSLGRRHTIASMQSNTRWVTRLLISMGACDVPAGDDSWADPYRFPWHRFTEDDAADLSARLASRVRNVHSRSEYVSRVRAILRQCRKQHLIGAECLEECLEAMRTPSGTQPPAGRALDDREIQALFEAAGADVDRWRGARDCAILAVFCVSGIRACELADLDLSDYGRDERRLMVLSKGRRETRPAYLTATACEYVDAWLAVRGGRPGPLFVSTRGKGLDTNRINVLLRRLGRVAGIAHFGSHDFRRTVATRLLRTTDIPTVMRILGHKRATTTMRYTREPEEHLRIAIASIDLPWADEPTGSDHGAPGDGGAGPRERSDG